MEIGTTSGADRIFATLSPSRLVSSSVPATTFVIPTVAALRGGVEGSWFFASQQRLPSSKACVSLEPLFG